MKSINFAEATHVLGVSQGYQPLAVLRTEEKGVVINNSYWQLEPEEIELLKQGHMVHLGVLGGQPPVLMAISNRPIEPLPYINHFNKEQKGALLKGFEPAPTPDDVKQVLTENKPNRKCAVCDGTAINGTTGEHCRFCNGGYLDAAN